MQIPKEAELALSLLEQNGHEAFVVGGCVRDSLLGRVPNDWDVTTSALPDEVAECFSAFRLVETGRRHGTLTVLVDGTPIEITTYRNDGIYLDHRHPVEVTFSKTVDEDLARRDFTVNAMAYHPRRGIVDLFGGREDLAARRIRCVGDPVTRFREDGLRILRALRFAAVLGFSLDPETAAAVHAERSLLSFIAPERIREELCKLICGVNAPAILREFSDVIGEFLPELSACVGFAQNSKYHCYDVFEHTLVALSHARRDLTVRLAVLLHDVGKPLCYTEDEEGGHFKGHGPVGTEMTERILRRLRFDRKTAETVTKLVERHDHITPAEEKAVKRLMQKMSDEEILALVEVQRCDRLAHAKGYDEPPASLAELPLLVKRIREKDACLSLKTLAVSGDDLLALGYPEGREIGRTLSALLDAVLDERLPNERDALLAEARLIRGDAD